MPPNSFCEWVAGSNVKQKKTKHPNKRPVLEVRVDTDDEADTDTISLTYPRTSSTMAHTTARKKQVRFAATTKGALKEPSTNFSADSESEVSTESSDTGYDESTTDGDDEVLSNWPCANYMLGQHLLKSLKQTNGKKKAEVDSSEDTSEDEATAVVHTKHKGKGKKKKVDAESSEDISEDTSEGPSEDETTAVVHAKHNAKKAKGAEQKKAKVNEKAKTDEKPKGQDTAAKDKNKGKGKGKKAKQMSDTESENTETDAEAETESEPESEAASEVSSSEEEEIIEIIRKKKSSKQAPKPKQNKKSQEKGGKEKGSKEKGGKDGKDSKDSKKDKSQGKGDEQGTEKKGKDVNDSDKTQPSQHYPYPPYPNMRAPDHPQPHLVQVEHAFESPYDPRPNAFYDYGNGVMRVYHGPFYGNPHATLYPRHVYQDHPHSPSKTPRSLNNGFVYDDHGRPMPPQYSTTKKSRHAAPQQGGGPPRTEKPSDWFQGLGTVTVDDKGNTSTQENKKKSSPPPQMPPVPEYTVNANVFRHAVNNTFSPPMRPSQGTSNFFPSNVFPSIESPELPRSDESREVSDKSKGSGTGTSLGVARQADWTDLWNTDINPPREPSPPPNHRHSSPNHHHHHNRSSTRNKHDDNGGKSKSEKKTRFTDRADHVFQDLRDIMKQDEERMKANEERWARLSRSSKEQSPDKDTWGSNKSSRKNKEPSPEKDNWGADDWGNTTNNNNATDDWGATSNDNKNDDWGTSNNANTSNDDWGNGANNTGGDKNWRDAADDSGDNGHNAASRAADWDWCNDNNNDNTNNNENNGAQEKNGSDRGEKMAGGWPSPTMGGSEHSNNSTRPPPGADGGNVIAGPTPADDADTKTNGNNNSNHVEWDTAKYGDPDKNWGDPTAAQSSGGVFDQEEDWGASTKTKKNGKGKGKEREIQW